MSSEEFRVGDAYRTNALSNEPGGSEVTVHFETGKPMLYDKIKKPKQYIAALSKRADAKKIVQIDVDGEPYWVRTEAKKHFF